MCMMNVQDGDVAVYGPVEMYPIIDIILKKLL